MKIIIGKWVRRYRLHILIWLLFIFYETIVIGLVSGVFGHPLTYIAHYISILLLFYSHSNISLPWAFKNKKKAFWKVPLVLVVEISLYIIVSYFIDLLLIAIKVTPYSQPFYLTYLYGLKMLYRGIYFIGFSTGYYFIITYIKERKKSNELEKEHLKEIIYRQKSEQELAEAQNAFLKAQINPHFLFNTLDFVYHNIVSLSPVAAGAIITLAEMMRYAIDSDKKGEFIILGEEIDQVENLLFLNQLRKDSELNFRLDYGENVRNIHLIPLVLLTLIENIFKHGNLDDPNNQAIVQIFIADNTLFIKTDNLVNSIVSMSRGHTGLFNIEQRLKFAYGDYIVFTHSTDDLGHFKVTLSVPLKLLKGPDGFSIISS